MIQLYWKDGWVFLEEGSYHVVLAKLLEKQAQQDQVNSLSSLPVCGTLSSLFLNLDLHGVVEFCLPEFYILVVHSFLFQNVALIHRYIYVMHTFLWNIEIHEEDLGK
jgi:hypothetical protein